MSEPILMARGVTKVFELGRQQVRALRGVDLDVREGEFLALVGPSGSGKTTFLNLVGALDVPTSGDLRVLGQPIAALSRRERADLRLRSIGFVFQAFNLVPVLTALENVEFVLELQGLEHRRDRARAVLHAWVDSVTAVVATPGVGRVVLIHGNGTESRIASPELPMLLSVPVSFDKGA